MGSFKRVKVSDHDDSFWVPDESVFGQSVEIAPCNLSAKADIFITNNAIHKEHYITADNINNQPDESEAEYKEEISDSNEDFNCVRDGSSSRSIVCSQKNSTLTGLDEFRRKSVEDFLGMEHAILEPSPREPRLGKRSSRALKHKIRHLRQENLEKELVVPLPPPSSSILTQQHTNASDISSGTSAINNAANERSKMSLLNISDVKSKTNPFEGSMDYWEQYDPDFIQCRGIAVITSNEEEFPVGVEALCFLCGSEGMQYDSFYKPGIKFVLY